MTDTTEPDMTHVPPMYAGRYTLSGRFLFCELCGDPRLPDTTIHKFDEPPTQDILNARLHMHEIAHAGTAALDPQLIKGSLDELANGISALREHVAAAVQHISNFIIQLAPGCATCCAEERAQTRQGHNVVNAIIDGTGYCNDHLDLVNGRLVPRKSSGLIIPGA